MSGKSIFLSGIEESKMKFPVQIALLLTLLSCSSNEASQPDYGNWSTVTSGENSAKFRNKFLEANKQILIYYIQDENVCFLEYSARYHWSISAVFDRDDNISNGFIVKFGKLKISEMLEKQNKYIKNISMDDFVKLESSIGLKRIGISKYISDMNFYKALDRPTDYGYLSIIMTNCEALEEGLNFSNDPELDFFLYNIRFLYR